MSNTIKHLGERFRSLTAPELGLAMAPQEPIIAEGEAYAEIFQRLEEWNSENEGYNELYYEYWDGNKHLRKRLCCVRELLGLLEGLADNAAVDGNVWRERCEELEVVAAALYLGHDDAIEQFDMYKAVYLTPSDADVGAEGLCQWCGATYNEHEDSRPEGTPVPRVPCLLLKSGFVDRIKTGTSPRTK